MMTVEYYHSGVVGMKHHLGHVRIGKKGYITIGCTIAHRLNIQDWKYCVLGYDSKTNELVIRRGLDPNEPGSYPIQHPNRNRQKQPTLQIRPVRALMYFKILPDKCGAYKCVRKADDTLFIKLDQEYNGSCAAVAETSHDGREVCSPA